MSEPAPQPVVLGGTPAIVQAGVAGADRLSKFQPQQVVVLICLLTTVVGMGLTVYLVFHLIRDHADERNKWQITVEAVGRSSDEDKKSQRDFFTLLDDKRSMDTNARLKMVLTHCADEAEKGRVNDAARWDKTNKFISTLTAELFKGRKIDPPEGQLPDFFPAILPVPNVMPAVAPFPREVVGPLTAG